MSKQINCFTLIVVNVVYIPGADICTTTHDLCSKDTLLHEKAEIYLPALRMAVAPGSPHHQLP